MNRHGHPGDGGVAWLTELGVFLGIWGVFEIQIKFCKFKKTKRFPSSKTCKLTTILSRWYVYTFFVSYTSKTYQNCMFPA